jgi:hypothetical protein
VQRPSLRRLAAFSPDRESSFPSKVWTTERGEVVTRRVLLAAVLIAAFWGAQSRIQAKTRSPETELVLLYHSDTKAETDECG